MKLRDLTAADKYLLLGNLLRKINPGRPGAEALKVIRSAEAVDAKLAAVLEIYRSQGEAEASATPPPHAGALPPARSPQRIRAGKPRILVLDPRTEISRILASSQFRKEYAFMHIRETPGAAADLWRCSPHVVIVNTEGEAHERLRLCRRLKDERPEVGVILLCSRAQLRAAQAGSAAAEGPHILTKPLNLMRMYDLLEELTG
jgi:hypothetical protein